jgi:DNA-binding FadR family transcriptional regulator
MREPTLHLIQPRLHRQMLTLLVDAILRGEYRPGELLPREVDLVEKFGVSRGVVREAIRGLEERDLISVRHGHGAIVRPSSEWDVLADDILPVLLMGPGSVEVLREVIEARRILEVEAAGLAAARATPLDFKRIREALTTMEALASPPARMTERDEFLEADNAFHERVIEATGNRALRRIVAPIHHSLLEARRPLARPEYRVTRAVPEHEAVLQAIELHDIEGARLAMQAVFATITDYLSEYAGSAQVPLSSADQR